MQPNITKDQKKKLKALDRLAGCIKLEGKPEDYGYTVYRGYIIATNYNP